MVRLHMERDKLAFQYVHLWKDTWGNDKSDTYDINLAYLSQINTETNVTRQLRVIYIVRW